MCACSLLLRSAQVEPLHLSSSSEHPMQVLIGMLFAKLAMLPCHLKARADL